MQIKPGLINLKQRQSALISRVNVTHGWVQIDIDFGAVVLNDLVGVHVSPAAFGEDPGVVDFVAGVVVVGHVGLCLHDHVLVVDFYVPHLAV